jgi:tetrapyrrole methylase family protein/MazG family protein
MAQGITIVGLGPGDPGCLTRRVWDELEAAQELYLRTNRLPNIDGYPLPSEVHSFDELYDSLESAPQVYRAIVETLLEKAARPHGVLYGVPGDPNVGEATVSELRRAAEANGLPCVIHPGLSFVEVCLDLMGIDALDGLVIADALAVASSFHPGFPSDVPALIGQLHSQLVASELKLTLLNQYPPRHTVKIIHGAGTALASFEELELRQLGMETNFDHVTSLLVPPMVVPRSSFESFQDTVAHLRSPVGCPWDREQTHLTLRQHLLEETYEALDAIDRGDMAGLREEMGDLMLQLVLQTQIATESGDFLMANVLSDINDKLIRRHPHVFAGKKVEGVDEVLHNWEALKASEREGKPEGGGALQGVPSHLPALAKSLEFQSRAARLGFDWPRVEGVLEKINEEFDELQAAQDIEEREAELGDILFALVNYGRWLEIDAEAALRGANRRFSRRFSWVERTARAEGTDMSKLELDELESLWQRAKAKAS